MQGTAVSAVQPLHTHCGCGCVFTWPSTYVPTELLLPEPLASLSSSPIERLLPLLPNGITISSSLKSCSVSLSAFSLFLLFHFRLAFSPLLSSPHSPIALQADLSSPSPSPSPLSSHCRSFVGCRFSPFSLILQLSLSHCVTSGARSLSLSSLATDVRTRRRRLRQQQHSSSSSRRQHC